MTRGGGKEKVKLSMQEFKCFAVCISFAVGELFLALSISLETFN